MPLTIWTKCLQVLVFIYRFFFAHLTLGANTAPDVNQILIIRFHFTTVNKSTTTDF